MKRLLLLAVLSNHLAFAQYDPLQANPGFENTATFSNWVLSGTGSLTRVTNGANSRSGTNYAEITSIAASPNYSTIHNTSFGITVPATGTNYVTVIAWARRSATGNSNVSVDVGTSADLNGPAIPGGAIVSAGGSYARVSYTFLAVNGETYHPVLYAQQNTASTVWWDDVIIYTSTQSITDIQAPAAPRAFTISAVPATSITFNFTQGPDTLANQSGIDGVLILRNSASNPLSHTAVPLLAQSFYSTNAAIGPTQPVANFFVVYNGPAISTYTDNFTGNSAVYLVYMRDKAFNYTAAGGTAFINQARLFVVNSATAGFTINGTSTNTQLDGIHVAPGNTLGIVSGSTTLIKPLSNCQIDGQITATGNLNTQGIASRITFKNGAVYRWQNTSGLFSNAATWLPGSLCWINNTTNGTTPSGGLNQTFANFRWQMPLQNTTYTLPTNFSVAGNVELLNSGTGAMALVGGNHTFGGNLLIDDDVTTDVNTTVNLNGVGITQTISGVGTITPNLGTLNINTSGGGKVVQSRNLVVNTGFNIASGAEFDGGSGNHILQMNGTSNFTNNGTFTAGNGEVRFNSTTPGVQTITTNNASPFYILDLQRPAGERVVMNSDVRVTNQFLFNGGLMVTNNNLLTVVGSITGPTWGSLSNSYVATCLASGSPATSGGLRLNGIGGGDDIVLGIGSSFTSYTPVRLNIQSGPLDDFTVRAAPGVAPGADIDFTAGIVWNVTEATPGGNQVQLNFQWNASDEGSNFTRATSRIIKSDGTSILPFEKGNFGAAAGADPYTRTSGTFLFTSFSPFSVSSEATLLPARFTYVRAKWQGNAAVLSWENATETPGVRYQLQRSADGQNFVTIATIAGTASTLSSRQYSFTDVQAQANKDGYYRVIAQEGTALYTSQIVKLPALASLVMRRLQLVPNIITGQSLQLSSTMQTASEVQAALVDNSGRVLFRQTLQLPAGSSTQSLPLKQSLAAGTYYLQLYSPSQGWKEVLTAVKQ
jgi:hypothetical protein